MGKFQKSHWKPWQDEQARALAMAGRSNVEIAQAIGRPVESVRLRVARKHWRRQGWAANWAAFLEAWSAGETATSIAERVGCRRQTVMLGIRRHIERTPGAADALTVQRKIDLGLLPKPPSGRVKLRAWKAWRVSEVRVLRELVSTRVPMRDVAATLGRSLQSVRSASYHYMRRSERPHQIERVTYSEACAWRAMYRRGMTIEEIARRAIRSKSTVGAHVREVRRGK